jgi:uncharacterized membrane protein HdeD (DUF308 family)
MRDFLKKTGWTNIITSIGFAVIGILLITQAESAVKLISYILGIVLIAMGILRIVKYFSNKEEQQIYNNDLIYGFIATILGLVVIFNSGAIEFIFRLVVGIWIVYSGILRCSLAIRLNKIGVQVWSLSLVMAILMIVAGIFIIFTEGALIKTIGIVVLAYAIMDLIQSIIFTKNIR